MVEAKIIDPLKFQLTERPTSAMTIVDQITAKVSRGKSMADKLGPKGDLLNQELSTLGNLSIAEQAAANERERRLNEKYVLPADLEFAIELALGEAKDGSDRKPLLLGGDPGVGKTQAAYMLAAINKLGGKHGTHIIHASGNTALTAENLMYTIDHVSRYSDAVMLQMPNEFRQLAEAQMAKLKGDPSHAQTNEFQRFMTGFETASKLLTLGRVNDLSNYLRFGELGQALMLAAQGEPVILLLDEIDKTLPSFDNELLFQLESLTLAIREMGIRIGAPRSNLFVIMTTNNTRDLAEAFKRRVFFHEIEFPSSEVLTQIVNSKFDKPIDQYLLQNAIDRFNEIRDIKELSRKPSPSELIDWVKTLVRYGTKDLKDLANTPNIAALIKSAEDLKTIRNQRRRREY